MKCPHCNGSGQIADSDLLFGKNSDLPAWLPPDTWEAYLEMRKKIKKPLTEYGKKLAIRELGRLKDLENQSPVAVLEQAILRDDQGLFPVKTYHGSNGSSKIGLPVKSLLDTERQREEEYKSRRRNEHS